MGGRTNTPLVPPKDLPSEASIKRMLKMCIDSAVFQAVDAQRFVNMTTNPDAFYERMEFLRQRLTYLADIERVDKKVIAGHPIQQLAQLDKDAPKIEADMWERFYVHCLAKAEARKTNASKSKAINSYFEAAEKYAPRLGKRAAAVIERNRSRAPKFVD